MPSLFRYEEILKLVAKRSLLSKEEVRAVYEATAEVMDEILSMRRNFILPNIVRFEWIKRTIYMTRDELTNKVVPLNPPKVVNSLSAKLPVRWSKKKKQPL